MSNLLNNGEMQVQALINAANQQAVNNQADNSVSDAEMTALQKKIEQQVELKNAQLKHSISEQEQFSKQQSADFDKALRGGLGPDAQRWAANPELQAKLTAAQKRLFLSSFGDSARQASTVAGAINRLAETQNFSQAVPTTQAMGELHAAVAANPGIEEPAKQLIQMPFMQAPRANTATKADFMRFGLQQMSKGNDLRAVKTAGDMLGVLANNVPGRAQQRAMAMVRRDPSNTEGMKNVDKFVSQPTVQKLPMMARGTATEALTKGNGNAPVAEGLEQVAQALTAGEVADPTDQTPPKPTPAAKKMSREMKARLFATIASGRPSELRGISDKALVALQSSAFPTRPNQVKRFMTALQARLNTNQGTAESIDPDQLLLHSKAGPLPRVPALRSTMGLSDEEARGVRAQNRALVMHYYQKVRLSYAGVSDKLAGGEYLEDVRTLPNLREADKIDLSHLSPEDAADLHPLLQSTGKQVQGTYQKLKVVQQKRMRELRGKRMPKAERMKRAAERRIVGMQPRYFNVSSLRQGRNAPSLPLPGQGVGKPMGKMGAQTVRMPVPNRDMAPGNDGMMASAPNPQMRAMGGPQGRVMPIPGSQGGGGGGGATADAMSAHIMSQVDRSLPFEAQMAQMQQVITQTLQQHMAVAQAQIMAATQKAMQSLMSDNAPMLPQEPMQQAPQRSQAPGQPAPQQRSQSPMPMPQAAPRQPAMGTPAPMGAQQGLELPSQEPAPAQPMGMQGQAAAALPRRPGGGGEAEFLRAPGPVPVNTPSAGAPMPAGDNAAQALAQQALASSGQLPPNGQVPGPRGNNGNNAFQPGVQPQGFDMAEAAAQAPHQAGMGQAPHTQQGQGFAQQAAKDGTVPEPVNPAPMHPMVGAPTGLGAVQAVGQQRSQGLATLFAAANAQGATPAVPGQPGQQAPMVAQAASPSPSAGMSVAALAQAAAQGTLQPNAATQEQAVAAAGGGLPAAPVPQNAPPMGGPKSLSAVEAVGARPQGQSAANQVAAYRQSTEAAGGAQGGSPNLDLGPRDSDGIPHAMRCPISLQVMERPVKASDGQIYDRSSIERWMQASPNPTSPFTRQPLTGQLEPQDALQQQIHAFVGSDPAVQAKLSPAQRQAVMAAVNEGIAPTHAMLRMFNSSQSTNAPVSNLLQEIRQPAPPPAALAVNPQARAAPAARPNTAKAKEAVHDVASLDAPPALPSAHEAMPMAAPRQGGPVQGKTDGWGIQRTFERDLGGANRAPVRPAGQNREITNPFLQNEPSYAELDQEKYKGRSVVKPSSRRRDLQTLYNTPWRQMTAAEQAPFKNLDWNHTTWDAKFSASAKWPSSMRTRFASLSSIKRESVRSLGFSAEEWDAYVEAIDQGGGNSSQGNPNQGRR